MRAFYGLIIATCLVGLVEVGLRLGAVAPAYEFTRLGRWQTTPNLIDVRMQGNREQHDFILNTNSDGLRTEIPRERTPGMGRVAIMGDSNVFGWGLSESETLAAQTEAACQKAGHKIEIINAGQPGYSTTQMGWLFEETLAAYEPDLTILFLSMHDENLVLVSDLEVWTGPQGLRAHARVFLAKHSRIYELIRRQLYSHTDTAQLLPHHASSEARVHRVSDSEYGQILHRLRTRAQTWGGQIAVGFLPNHADLFLREASVTGRYAESWVRAWSSEVQMPLMDLRDCCIGDPEDKVFSFDQGHLNARGNAEVGISFAEALVPLLH